MVEEQIVKDFMDKDCCKRKCNLKLKSEEVLKYRAQLKNNDVEERGTNQLDLILLGLIHNLVRVSEEEMPCKRIKITFAFRTISICRTMWMFTHIIDLSRLKKIIQLYKTEGNGPKLERKKMAFVRNHGIENSANLQTVDEANIGDNDFLLISIDEIKIWADCSYYKKELGIIKNLRTSRCCALYCIKKFTTEELLLYRLRLMSLDVYIEGFNSLDLVLSGLIHSFVRDSDEISHAGYAQQKPRQRNKISYALRGITVCRAIFMVAHAIKLERLKRLQKIYKNEGLIRKPHGNCKSNGSSSKDKDCE